jgi:esterase/lipase superfamily enzyme
MYVSARDRALKMSRFLQDSVRAGFTPPVTVLPQIDTVEVTNIDLTLLGHSYYAEAEGVLYDMQALLTSNTPPEQRARLESGENAAGGRYWIINR